VTGVPASKMLDRPPRVMVSVRPTSTKATLKPTQLIALLFCLASGVFSGIVCADPPPSAPDVDPRVSLVFSCCTWSEGVTVGVTRLVVNESRDTSGSEVWLEWVETPANGARRVVEAVKVTELSNRGLSIGQPDIVRVRPHPVLRFMRYSSSKRYDFMLAVEGRGKYRCLGCD
jgi:hypothetical protein